MSALASLVRAYDRLATRSEVPAFGYSQEKIGFLISLNDDGTPAGPPIDLREIAGTKRLPRMMAVPAAFKRPGSTPRSFFLWDNTAFALGVSRDEKKSGGTRLSAFRERHNRELIGSNDKGLVAFLAFVNSWQPDDFVRLGWPEEMKDQNIVFALESERRGPGNSIYCIHDRAAARQLWAQLSAEGDKAQAVCLVTGERGPIARIHPSIKGIRGPGGSKDADSIVSFNKKSFESYDHTQGYNSPVSEYAAFRYVTALNHFLEKGSRHRVQIGDASTVFWADATDAEAAATAEAVVGGWFGLEADEDAESEKVGAILEKIRTGRPIEEIRPDLPQGVRFFVLGLSPNAARLSVRFYMEDDFGIIAKRCLEHVQRMRIDPPPREETPSMWRLLIETAVLRKSENIPPNLAGEWMRAILGDTPYPLPLLSTLIMRLRADHDVNALRVAILKSVLIRNFSMEAPVSLDPDNKDPGYLLGRLFATYEQIQTAALGRNVNATIKDKFYGAAASQPRKVFPLLDKGSKSHLAKIGKEHRGYQIVLDRQVAEIMEAMSPGDDPFPAHLPDRQQGLFALGYYHQRNNFFVKTEKSVVEEVPNEHT